MSNKLLQNSAKLLSANIFAQAVGLAVYPILTRIYAPEDFGLLNLFLSISSIFILLSTTDYQMAIVLPKAESQSKALVHLNLAISTVVFLLLSVSVIFARPISSLFNMPELATWYPLLPLYVLLNALWNILSYWYIRHAEYNRNSGYQITQSSIGAGLKIGFGHMGWLQGGMIISMVIAPLISLIVSLSLAWKHHIKGLQYIDKNKIREVATTYRKFPLYSFPSSLLNMLSSQLPVLLLAPFFGAKELGFWSMAILLGFAPLSMLSKTLNQTLYQHTMDSIHAGRDIRPMYRKITLWGMVGIGLSFTLLWFILPSLTTLLLGADWLKTGHLLRWMLPWVGANILTASTGFLAGIYFKQTIELLFEILMITVRLVTIGVGVWLGDFTIFAACYSLSSCAVTIAHYIWLMILVKRSSTDSQL